MQISATAEQQVLEVLVFVFFLDGHGTVSWVLFYFGWVLAVH